MTNRHKSATMNLRVEPALKAMAERIAAAERRSVTSLIELAIIEYAERRGIKPEPAAE